MHIDDFGADPSGARPSDAALTEAIAALDGRPGVVRLGAGNYRFDEPGAHFGIAQGLVGPGKAVCTLLYAGSAGRFLSFSAGSRFEALQNSTGAPQGGPVRGFSVHSATDACVDAVWWSDLCAADMDIAVKGFTAPGSHGLRFENVYGFCEGMQVRAAVQNCDTQVRFSSARHAVTDVQPGSGLTTFTVPAHGLIDGSWVYALLGRFSFDYSAYDFWVVAHPGQNGVVLEHGNAMYGCELIIRGNFIGRGPTNGQVRPDTGFTPSVLTIGSGAVNRLGDGNPLDGAHLTGSLRVNVECEGTAGDVGHSTVAFGGYEAPTGVIGEMLYLDGAARFSDAQGLFTGANFSFIGLGDLHPITYGAKYPLTLQNTKLAQKPGGVWITGAGGALVLNFSIEGSSRFAHTCDPGAHYSVNFQNLSPETLDSFDVLLQQPFSGALASVTWPAAVSWGRAGTPELSGGPGQTDWLRFMTIDGGRSWFGTVVAQELGGV
jgi:hypothetical protein